ncbi:hypothetical protein PN451_14890 [Dolichospermum planctonicum CS-1226]|uniref:Uncharacterized protein n=1 Tax=Dolichospermum planctonicum CS-1226 TaxID=3021751 RepID=A0ABT5AIG3_9CYAN|nr:hypothetical protein [Dolichospermum planctonicum CS-1226]
MTREQGTGNREQGTGFGQLYFSLLVSVFFRSLTSNKIELYLISQPSNQNYAISIKYF